MPDAIGDNSAPVMQQPIEQQDATPAPTQTQQSTEAQSGTQQSTGAQQATEQTQSTQQTQQPTQVDQPDQTDVASTPEADASDQAEQTVTQWLTDLSADHNRFHDAMKRLFGESYDKSGFESVRRQVAQGDTSLVPKVRFATDADAAPAADGELVLPAELADRPIEAAMRVAGAMAPALAKAAGVTVDPATIDATHLATEINPAENGELVHYLNQPPANETDVPPLFASAGLEYGSRPWNSPSVSIEGITKDYIAAWIGTPPEVGQMDDGGIANMLNPEWRAAVASAAEQNGGLGDSENGFLAFSKEYGFVRLRNPRLTAEQNRRLAEMSLTLGVPIETIPSRAHESAFLDKGIDKWVNEIIGRYDKEMADFRADPTDSIRVNDGRKRYVLEFNEEAGRFVSYDFKKSGGLKGFMQRNMDVIAPILDVVGVAANIIPGIGQAASAAIAAGSQALKSIGGMIAAGKASAMGIFNTVAGFIPGIGKALGFSQTQTALAGGVLKAGAQYADTGSIDVSALVGAAAPSIFKDLTGNPLLDMAAEKAVVMAASAIEDGKIDATDAIKLINTLATAYQGKEAAGAAGAAGAATDDGFFDNLKDTILDAIGIDEDTADLFEKIGRPIVKAVVKGEFSAEDIAKAIIPLAGEITEDPEAQAFFREAVKGIAGVIDSGKLDAMTVFDKMLPAFIAAFEAPPQKAAA